jgi:hypothetical protein
MRLLPLAVLMPVLNACGEARPDPWRADAAALLARTERLAEAGEIAAARGTLAELEKRDDPAALDLAFEHDGLAFSPDAALIAGGDSAGFSIRSDFPDWHLLELWRIDDDAVWHRLCRYPDRGDLPAAPERSLDLPPGARRAIVAGLPEGRYVATLRARACPVVVLRSLRVAVSAVDLQAGNDGALLWTVTRTEGRGAATPVRWRWELDRDAQQAAGAAWDEATPSWRAGFTEGYLGRPDPAWFAGDHAAEQQAGAAAAAADPAYVSESETTTAGDGLLRLPLPPQLTGRAWTLRLNGTGKAVGDLTALHLYETCTDGHHAKSSIRGSAEPAAQERSGISCAVNGLPRSPEVRKSGSAEVRKSR